MSVLAPAARRSFTQSTLPFQAANINAVQPQLPLDVCGSERRLAGARAVDVALGIHVHLLRQKELEDVGVAVACCFAQREGGAVAPRVAAPEAPDRGEVPVEGRVEDVVASVKKESSALRLSRSQVTRKNSPRPQHSEAAMSSLSSAA
eukprot:s3058_g1.t1